MSVLWNLRGSESECGRGRQDLAIAESQLRDYQARLGKRFVHEGYLSQLTGLRDQLKNGLSGATQEPGNGEGPSVPELAERIKTLKAAHSIEAMPQRVRQEQSTAEEPVTARIRRRTEAVHASDRAIEPDADASGAGATPLAETDQESFVKSPMTFQEHILRGRQRTDEGATPA